ncbi:MAG TPA: hypothetical protein VE465_13895 [Streptosporangiaceae bacterium]|jgi:hypothetical protein|nr:hypothetical protein [Streptosporangiaceae bacterium]
MANRKPQPEVPEQPVEHSADAIKMVWDSSTAHRATAFQLAQKLDEIDTYIARAQADRDRLCADHAAALGKANGLAAMVREYCERHGLPLPQTPAPDKPVIDAALAGLDDRARKHPTPVNVAAPLSAAEIAQDLDPEYGHLLGLAVKVWVKGTLEVLTGILARVDAEWITLLDEVGAPRSHPRSMVDRIEPRDDHRDNGDNGPGGDPLQGYGRLPDRPAEGTPMVGEQPAAEARALTAGPLVLLAAGLWLAARPARRRAAWARTGHWRHRAGALHSAVRSAGAVRGAVV